MGPDVSVWRIVIFLYCKRSNNGEGETLYFYDDSGIRTTKVWQNLEYRYLLNGTQIVGEMWGDSIVIYLYDENGSPIGMQHKGGNNPIYTYFFEKNVFGDIVAVYGSDGTRYVTYRKVECLSEKQKTKSLRRHVWEDYRLYD